MIRYILFLEFNLKDWLSNLGKKLKFEFQDLFNDFIDFFDLIKENTYDVLCDKFGTGIINLLGIGLIFLIIMIVAMKIINR